ncbi:hypothetical protein [uncultured Chloroflexus sp.]|uniref:hypothetical protein n=1 Tax=uncultured Chloroflexus sp. TaxID=214040 RepID=UPI002633FF81|nr:hypothetical protein [uncultured Chloroflexus sp.]
MEAHLEQRITADRSVPGCCQPTIDVALTEAEANQLAESLSLLAHPIRLRLLAIPARNGGHVCVCDLEAAWNTPINTFCV